MTTMKSSERKCHSFGSTLNEVVHYYTETTTVHCTYAKQWANNWRKSQGPHGYCPWLRSHRGTLTSQSTQCRGAPGELDMPTDCIVCFYLSAQMRGRMENELVTTTKAAPIPLLAARPNEEIDVGKNNLNRTMMSGAHLVCNAETLPAYSAITCTSKTCLFPMPNL